MCCTILACPHSFRSNIYIEGSLSLFNSPKCIVTSIIKCRKEEGNTNKQNITTGNFLPHEQDNMISFLFCLAKQES